MPGAAAPGKLPGKLKPNSFTLSRSLAGRRPVRDQIPLNYSACDQLASRSVTSSRAGSRASSELDEDLRAHVADQIPLRYPACDQLASRSATSL